ncbi:MAG: NfeD family protein [Clostridiales bacterium]|jgi:membrane protein implicated in regulation of membrane protease activity|nr:NfeD family protein [Clostridiales bacterium]
MQSIFWICFGVGVGYIFIGFILGEILNVFDFDADGGLGDGLASPLKPSVIAAFLTVFGGSGVLLIKNEEAVPALLIALLLGVAVAFIFYRFIITPLYGAQNTSAVAKQSLIGSPATVTETIPQGGYGKITYFVNGNVYSAPAKSDDGHGIERMSEVEIAHIEKNTYFVRRRNNG